MNGIIDHLVTGLSAMAVGAVLGVVFFGGLWITLQRLPDSTHPFLLMTGSLVARTATVLAGLWYFTRGEPLRVMAAMIGLIAVQMLMTYRHAFPDRSSRGSSSR